MTALPIVSGDCWNRIGVRGDRSCPELVGVVHCQNCPVFATAGRQFLDMPVLPGYRDEWTERLAAPIDDDREVRESVLIFRVADEWLAMNVQSLVEVATPKPVHRVPHRAGILNGLVNLRGELHLSIQIAKVLGQESRNNPPPDGKSRLLLIRSDADRWVLPVDAVDRVRRIPQHDIELPPATITRALAHVVRGVFHRDGRAIGLLDEPRLFELPPVMKSTPTRWWHSSAPTSASSPSTWNGRTRSRRSSMPRRPSAVRPRFSAMSMSRRI
jgi:chemotaxis-related protein WspD